MWSYDSAGNILSKQTYSYTTGTLGTATATVNYGYSTTDANGDGKKDWGDLLIRYNGAVISNDAIGNITYDEKDRYYTWEHGRQLKAISTDEEAWTYTYDASGMRTGRSNGSTTYAYVYSGSQLKKLTVGGNTLLIQYGTTGMPVGLTYNNTRYYYVTNLQGDVIAILNGSGTAVVTYTYDAWGNILTTTDTSGVGLASKNPLRYRGYVYDNETGLYYLQSRYYNPAMGRFICADGMVSTGTGLLGYNMFAYCNNNPVNYADDSGAFPIATLVVAVVACLVIIGVDHYVGKNYPDGLAVGEEMNDNGVLKKGLFVEGNGFELDENGITICDMEAGLFSGTYFGDNLEASLFDIFCVSATAELDWSGLPSVDISAVASIYTADFEYTIPIFGDKIIVSGSLHIGAIGGGIEFNPEEGKFEFMPPGVGVIPSFGIDFDD